MRRTLRASVAAACIVMTAAPPSLAETALAASSPLDVRVAQAAKFSRIEFHWQGRAGVSVRREGQVLTLRFNRDAKPDLADLKTVPLRWLKAADVRHEAGALVVALTLAEGADAKTGEADGATFVNLFEKTEETASQVVQAPPPRANPVPAGGAVTMRVSQAGLETRLDFPWANPLGAAVFERGNAIWVVFDARARMNLAATPKESRQIAGLQTLQGDGWTAVRIATRGSVNFIAQQDGGVWSVVLAPAATPIATQVAVERSDADGPVSLAATLSGASAVYWINDPAVGDRLAVVTALGPPKVVPARRDFVQAAVLRSAQGLAVEPMTDDIAVAYDGDLVSISRPRGLILSPVSADAHADAREQDAPAPAPLPGLIDASWANTGKSGFLARYDTLSERVAAEVAKGQAGSAEPHLALARFLVGEGLSYEAIGVLNDGVRRHPQLASSPEFRGLRGIARVMAGRLTEAETDFSHPSLTEDPSSAAWRGYIAAQGSQWEDARRELGAGAPAMGQFSPQWRARFALAGAQASLALADTTAAQQWVSLARAQPLSHEERLPVHLMQARVFEATGDSNRALNVYRALTQAPGDEISGPATLRATKIGLDKGLVTPVQAANTFDGLRYRWRGGAFELEVIRTLGQLYLSQGRYREALEALRSAGKALPDLPEAVQLQTDLATAFKGLFLDGEADGLEPVQALALFYDFKELTPVGADGDLMVRRLTRRLVDVDLLSQAEELLKYQAENRLEGAPRAQVATDLALIYLMDKKPEQAIDAINASRTTVLPTAMNLQRRIISARAYTALGRYDAALEMLGADNSADAMDARTEVAWKQKDWPQAAAMLERQLGERYRQPGPLSADEEGKVLRAGVAMSLADDQAGLNRLSQRWSPFVDQARNPDALKVALAGFDPNAVSAADFGRIAADNQAFAGWVAKMKQRFREKAAAPPVRQAEAAPAKPAA